MSSTERNTEQRLQSRRTCDALGVCQQHKPACKGCNVVPLHGPLHGEPLRLAPGVVEAYRTPFFGSPSQRRELLRWAQFVALWVAVLTGTAFLAGLLAGFVK